MTDAAPTLDELNAAASIVYQSLPATPQYVWPQINARVGATVWVKHENHTPIGAFKARGAVTFIDWLRSAHPEAKGIVTATRGNHGQAQARAATAAGLTAKIYVPEGNSVEKNAAMRGFGAEVVVHGADFDEARLEAGRAAEAENLYFTPPFHPSIMKGVASYALELFAAAQDLDVVYVPIGCGSGICGNNRRAGRARAEDRGRGRGLDRGAGGEAVGGGRPADRDEQRPHLRRRHGGAGPGAGGVRHLFDGGGADRLGQRRRGRRGHPNLFPGHAQRRRRRRGGAARGVDAGAQGDAG